MANALDDDDILHVCLTEMRSIDSESGDLEADRTAAIERYLGEPDGYEVDGESKFVSREVYEAIETLMPSLMRIFTEADNVIDFTPRDENDEDQAQQETDAVRHIFDSKNRGFYNLYTFCKDALTSRTGLLKVWHEEHKREREEYRGLTDEQLGELLMEQQEEGVDIELVDGSYQLNEDGSHDITIIREDHGIDVHIEPVAPEEFGISRTARSPYIEDATFSFTRSRKTAAQLRLEGVSQDIIDTLPKSDDVETQERRARRYLSDETDTLSSAGDDSMREYWISECYVRVDRDGDDLAELLKVTIGSGATESANGKLISIEEIDRVPVFGTPCNLLTHKFYGLSIADAVREIQLVMTSLTRAQITNAHLANNGTTVANIDKVNIEDVLRRRPKAVVRVKGNEPWQQSIGPMPYSPLPPEVMALKEDMMRTIKRRTGAGDDVAGLDADSISNVNSSVAAMQYEAAHMKIELIARIVAEIGLKPLFHYIHELMIKNNYRAEMLKLRGKWTEVNPGEWRERKDSEVAVGTGNASKVRKVMFHEQMIEKQMMLIQAQPQLAAMLIAPHQLYQAYYNWARASGFEPGTYFTDPRTIPPPEPKEQQPDPLTMAQVGAFQADAQAKMITAQTRQAEAQANQQYKVAEMQLQRELKAAEYQVKQLEVQVEAADNQRDADLEARKLDQQAQIENLKAQLTHLANERDRQVDAFKAEADALAKLNDQMRQERELFTQAQERAANERAQSEAQAQQGVQQTGNEMREFTRLAMESMKEFMESMQGRLDEFEQGRTRRMGAVKTYLSGDRSPEALARTLEDLE